MLSLIIAKLYNTIIEQKVRTWAKHDHKHALGQACNNKKQSIVD